MKPAIIFGEIQAFLYLVILANGAQTTRHLLSEILILFLEWMI